jgi:uncharacterized repeat protein (TIGR01451 family)
MPRVPQQLLRLTLSLALGLAVAAAGTASPWGAAPRPGAANATVKAPLSGAAAGSRVPVMVELAEPPAAVDWAAAIADRSVPKAQALANARRASRAKIALLKPRQSQLSARLAAAPLNAQELFRLQRVMNAVAVMIEPAKLDQIRALPGVKRVRVITPEFPTNATSVPFIGAPELWANTIGLPENITGTGVRIGIIDTGIDYQHPMFGGTGALADYKANDRVTIHPGLFPTAKVVGGFDFVGDAYDGSNTPMPDPNPMDCFAHGSHVAGTAAGFGVNSDGTPYTGPYGPAPTTPFSSLRIGPGVAPGALLYAIRIFGCGGSTGVTTQGIEFAVDPDGDGDLSDHLDVINMSLGSPYGGLSDTSAQAADAAALVGVIVVSAQGNSGDTYFIGGSPGSAERGIAAAASVDAGIPGAVLTVNAPASIAGNYAAAAAAFGGGTPPPAGQTGSVVEVQSATGTAPQGCDGNYTNAAAIKGNIALIMRGTCSFQKKVTNAQAAGAIGAIVFNNVPGDPTLINMGGDGVSPPVTIPSLFISFDDGMTIAGASGVNATLNAASAADTLASFSSRGPRGGGSFPIGLKPDVAAPGVAIPSTQTGIVCTMASQGCIVPDPSGFIPGGQVLVLSGTSMATPHTAGTMALLRQLHPDWSVEELKALLMNGALHDITVGVNGAGATFGLGRVGAGRIDVPSSAQNSVTAFNDDDPGTVTLGFDSPVVGSVDQVKQLRVVNHGSQAATFDLGVDNRTAAPGVSFSLADATQATLSVPAGSAVQVPVQMQATAAKMDHGVDSTVAPGQAAPAPLNGLGVLPRHWLTEAGSYLTFGQGGTTKLRVPLYSAPVAASAMAGTAPIPTGGAGAGTTAIQLSGIGVCTGTVASGQCSGNFPATEASLVTPFELQAVHALDPTIPSFANLQYVGVAYDRADNLLLFGISTWGPWSSPTDVAFNVYIDTQNSGTFDKILFNSNPGEMAQSLFGNGGANGQDSFITAFFDTAAQTVSTENFVNLLPANIVDSRLFANNVIVLAVSPIDLGLKSTAFRYRVESCPGFLPLCTPLASFRYDGVDGPFTWDFGAQGLDFGGNFLAFDLDGTSLPANFNVGNYLANHSLGALLLHHHNTGGTQAQVLPIQGSRFADVSVAAAIAPATVPAAKINTQVTLTIQAANAGPNRARQVVVFDSLPAGLTYLSDDGGGAYDPSLGLWTVGQLGVGANATLHIRATVTGTGEIVNTAQIGSSKPIDPNPENDVAQVTLNAPRLADLAVTAGASAGSVKAGTGVTFTVTVDNNGANFGADPSYNPRVHVILGGAKYDAKHISVSQGSFDPASGIWQLGSVGSGAKETLQFRVVPLHTGSVGINVNAIASTPDPNLINNHASVSVAVH